MPKSETFHISIFINREVLKKLPGTHVWSAVLRSQPITKFLQLPMSIFYNGYLHQKQQRDFILNLNIIFKEKLYFRQMEMSAVIVKSIVLLTKEQEQQILTNIIEAIVMMIKFCFKNTWCKWSRFEFIKKKKTIFCM